MVPGVVHRHLQAGRQPGHNELTIFVSDRLLEGAQAASTFALDLPGKLGDVRRPYSFVIERDSLFNNSTQRVDKLIGIKRQAEVLAALGHFGAGGDISTTGVAAPSRKNSFGHNDLFVNDLFAGESK